MTQLNRRIAAGLVLALVLAGCAGPAKLTQKSESKLADGDIWRAWTLATRALDKEPMNPRAQAAAAAAGRMISDDWQRRIHALAAVDTLKAAEQVLEFISFRTQAATYATIDVPLTWPAEEQAFRRSAASSYYNEARGALAARRPKLAYDRFLACQRFLPSYRDAVRLADKALDQATTRIAVMPFEYPAADAGVGREVGEQWRDALAQGLAPPRSKFTRVLGSDVVEGQMTVAQLGRLSREDAVKLGRRIGAQRIVRGTVGPASAETHVQIFRDVIARRVVDKSSDGRTTTVRWVDVPIEVVARVRDVKVDLEYEVVSTRDGATLAHVRAPRNVQARAVWTSYVPEGELGDYSLVSETVRNTNPVRTRDVETRWKAVCGESTTLQQVLGARRETRGGVAADRASVARIVAGAAFVFLEELPSAQELALGAVKNGWQPLLDDLARMDAIDDVDLSPSADGDLH